jgi:hypothetical protein
VNTHIVTLADGQEQTVIADSVTHDGGALKFSTGGKETLVLGPGVWTAYRLGGTEPPRLAGLVGPGPAVRTGPVQGRSGGQSGRGGLTGIVYGRRGLPPRTPVPEPVDVGKTLPANSPEAEVNKPIRKRGKRK